MNATFELRVGDESFSAADLFATCPFKDDQYWQSVWTYATAWAGGMQALEFQTSGSTGLPKKIVHTREAILASVMSTAQALNLQQGDTALLCMNVEMMGGRMMLYRAMVLGLKLTVVKPSGNPLAGGVNAYDFISLVPLQLEHILNDKQSTERLQAARIVIVGGAPVSAQLQQKLQILKPTVYSTYGMTETISHVALQRLNSKPAETDYQVLNGIEFGLDQRQCLWFKGKMTNAELVQTNDLGVLTSSSSFRVLGRYDQVINSAGVKLNPFMIEEEISGLLSEFGVKEFFLAGLPHQILGQELVLFTSHQCDQVPLLAALKVFLKDSPYSVPKRMVTGLTFHYTSSGKVDRTKTIASLN